MVNQHVKVRRASKIALGANSASQPKSVADHVKKSRAMIEFQILSLQSELKLLDELNGLAGDEKTKVLFNALDKDSTGSIPASQLVDGLGQVQGDIAFKTRMALVLDEAFPKTQTTIDATTFAGLLDQFVIFMDCTMNDLVETIVINVLFPDNLMQPKPATVSVVVEEKKQDDEMPIVNPKEIRRAMRDERMQALFRVFDQHDHGTVDFQDIVIGMYKAFPSLDDASHAAVAALLLFDKENKRELNYQEFARFMLNVTASAPDRITFDDVADTLTRNAVDIASGVSNEYVFEKYSMDKSSKLLLDLTEDVTFLGLGVVELGKLDRLFTQFDNDNDGRINAKEMVLGLSKLHDTIGMKTIVKESEHVISTFDKDASGTLDKQEFASFIVNFAKTSGLALIDFLDFMLVVEALKDNADAEQEYMSTVKGETYQYWYG